MSQLRQNTRGGNLAPKHGLPLDDARATDLSVAGAKGANLARALAAGLPVLPGYVLPTAAPPTPELVDDLAAIFTALDETALVVRSSSTIEDVGSSSMAGQFRSVLDVSSLDALVAAVQTVRQSAFRPDLGAAPMAVIIQPQLDAAVSGVLFGVDPVTGVEGRLVVEAVSGGPDQLVSGQVTAERATLNRTGRLLAIDGVRVRTGIGRRRLLDRAQYRALAALARDLEREYGGPQDVEWAFDTAGRLVLLQTRPVTTRAPHVSGPVLGPGPVAETFPHPLRPLECDLWLDPMREGIVAALSGVGVVPQHTLAASPVLLEVKGWPAVDLGLFGYVDRHRHGWQWIDPRPPMRRLAAAWRVGSLRARLPEEAAGLIAQSDEVLGAVTAVPELPDQRLTLLLEQLGSLLVDLHTHEVLAASITSAGRGSLAGEGLAALRRERAAGLSDAAVVHREPVVLALIPPRVGGGLPLPEVPRGQRSTTVEQPGVRELLRLRIRWVQELEARICTDLGRRLAASGALPSPDAVAWLRLTELTALVAGGSTPPDLSERMTVRAGPPLPTRFRLADDGSAVSAERRGARPQGGVGAGGGRGVGTVVHADSVLPNGEPDQTSIGRVLVVRTLDPVLAARLPGLAGLVSESGSTLSHLAILAREFEVPTVVAVHDAMHRFPVGSEVVVDGRTGEVLLVEPEVTS